jgi:hypothetical protein
MVTTLATCKAVKCAKLNKKRQNESVFFVKEEKKKCPQKSAKAFYNCSSVVYDKSKYKVLFDKYVACAKYLI